MEKRILGLLLTITITITITVSFAACRGDIKASREASEKTETEIEVSEIYGPVDFDKEPVTLTVCYPVMQDALPGMVRIQELVNEITLAEINCKVEFEPVSLSDMSNIYALKMSSQKKLDLMCLFPGSRYMISYANMNMIIPLDDYMDTYGGGIIEAVGEIMDAGQYHGQQYAIPQNMEPKSVCGIRFLGDALEKYGFKADEITTINDLDEVFAAVKENEPDLIILAPETSSSNLASTFVSYDGLGNTYGVLPNGGNTEDTTLINQYEDEVWINIVKKIREWYQAGYISKDILTSQDEGITLQIAGKVFATAGSSANGYGAGSTDPYMVTSPMAAPVIATTDIQLYLWAVSSSSQYPQQCIQFLSLLDSSAELSTLLKFGIKDEHYEILEDGSVNRINKESYLNDWLAFGDVNKTPEKAESIKSTLRSAEEFEAARNEWIASTIQSVGYGFIFDSTSVKTEIAALDAVKNEYTAAIANGTVNPETEIARFNEKLYAAGLQTVIDEKQRQFDVWLAEQEGKSVR